MARKRLCPGAAVVNVVNSVFMVSSISLHVAYAEDVSPSTGAWDRVQQVLQDAVNQQSFPGAVAMVTTAHRTEFATAVGRHTYEAPSVNNPAMGPDTLFDLASLTKVLATTSATMILYERGDLHLSKFRYF